MSSRKRDPWGDWDLDPDGEYTVVDIPRPRESTPDPMITAVVKHMPSRLPSPKPERALADGSICRRAFRPGRSQLTAAEAREIDELLLNQTPRIDELGQLDRTTVYIHPHANTQVQQISPYGGGAAAPVSEPAWLRSLRCAPLPTPRDRRTVGSRVFEMPMQTEEAESWLVREGQRDYGPFTTADVIRLIDKGEYGADTEIIEVATGIVRPVEEHQLFAAALLRAEQRRHRETEQQVDRRHVRLYVALIIAWIVIAVVAFQLP